MPSNKLSETPADPVTPQPVTPQPVTPPVVVVPTRKIVLEFEEDVCAQMDKFARSIEEPTYFDEKLQAFIKPLKFPGGFEDWAAEVLSINIQQCLGQRDPVVVQIQEQIAALHKLGADRFKAIKVKQE